jgi:hypothetical protein
MVVTRPRMLVRIHNLVPIKSMKYMAPYPKYAAPVEGVIYFRTIIE